MEWVKKAKKLATSRRLGTPHSLPREMSRSIWWEVISWLGYSPVYRNLHFSKSWTQNLQKMDSKVTKDGLKSCKSWTQKLQKLDSIKLQKLDSKIAKVGLKGCKSWTQKLQSWTKKLYSKVAKVDTQKLQKLDSKFAKVGLKSCKSYIQKLQRWKLKNCKDES